MGFKMFKTNMFPYIEGAQLVGKKPARLTMRNVQKEVLHSGEHSEEKFVLYFQETSKGLVLNKTNTKTIIAHVGSDDTDDWSGHVVELYAEQVKAFGQIHDAVRVRGAEIPPAERQQRQEAAADAVAGHNESLFE